MVEAKVGDKASIGYISGIWNPKYSGKVGEVTAIYEQEPYDMLTIRVNNTDLTIFSNEVSIHE